MELRKNKKILVISLLVIIAIIIVVWQKNILWRDVSYKSPEEFATFSSKVEVSQRSMIKENGNNPNTSLLVYSIEIINKSEQPIKIKRVQIMEEKVLNKFLDFGSFVNQLESDNLTLAPGKGWTINDSYVLMPRYDQLGAEDKTLLDNNLQTKYIMIDYGFFSKPDYIKVTGENLKLKLQ